MVVVEYRADMPRVEGWILKRFRRWWQRCSRCRKRFLLAYFYEVYGPITPIEPEPLDVITLGKWWYECEPCFVITMSNKCEEEISITKALIGIILDGYDEAAAE